MATTIEVIRRFFGDVRPVTTQELLDLRKANPKGYEDIARECATALGVTLDLPKSA